MDCDYRFNGCKKEAKYLVSTAGDVPLCEDHRKQWIEQGDWSESEFKEIGASTAETKEQ